MELTTTNEGDALTTPYKDAGYASMVSSSILVNVKKLEDKPWMQAKSPASTVSVALESVDHSILNQKVIKVCKAGRRVRLLSIIGDKIYVTHQKVKKSGLGIAKGFFSFMLSSKPRYVDVADLNAVDVGAITTMVVESVQAKAGLVNQKEIDKLVTIWHHGFRYSITLLVEDPKTRKNLVRVLQEMKDVYAKATNWVANEALLLRYIWSDVDIDKSGLISADEFVKICARINFAPKNPRKDFAVFAKKVGKKDLNYSDCMALLEGCKGELPAQKIFVEAFGTANGVDAKVFFDSFLKKQDQKSTLDDAEALLKGLDGVELNDVGSKASDGLIGQQEFGIFLHSAWNDAYDPARKDDAKALDMPLSMYWTNTSHNTYLTGDQLQSRSSVEAYARALLRGCKCLELDCWDGTGFKDLLSTKSDVVPIVFHGHTLTSKISFESIIHVVNSYVLAHPKGLPIILSLENHCSHPYQKEMADIMQRILKKRLYIPPADHASKPLPAPESLRGMVLIKGKRPPEPDETEEIEETDDIEETAQSLTASNASAKPSKIVPELAAMTLFNGTKFKTFEKSIAEPTANMHSIGETKIQKILKKGDNPSLWQKYNVDHMTRTYPAGARIDSSNYNPIVAWREGCQLVALNFQTFDNPLFLNDGRFRENGSCGYVPKPSSIVKSTPDIPMKIQVRVLNGSCLPKPGAARSGEVIDSYCKVEVHDVKTAGGKVELSTSSFSTSSISNNGFCPVWDSAPTVFDVESPSVAMIQFTVLDEDVGLDDVIGVAAIPISCLRFGYRSVKLYDRRNTRSGAFGFATLLVEIRQLSA